MLVIIHGFFLVIFSMYLLRIIVGLVMKADLSQQLQVGMENMLKIAKWVKQAVLTQILYACFHLLNNLRQNMLD